jgi:hypothetical protein
LILHSEYTDGANWSNEGSIVDEENTSETISPEGVYNAVKLVSANATSEQWIQATGISVTTGNDCTISCFVKKSDYDYFHIRFTGIGGAFSAGSIWFNIANGTLGTAQTGITGTIEDYGNGWYRISATKEVIGTTANAGVRFQLASSDNNTSVVGDGSKGTYIYGCQAELGSYPTSYIPTYGSSVTRSFDNMNSQAIVGDLSNNYTFFFDAVRLLDGDETQRWFYTTGLNGTNLQVYFISGGIDGRIRLFFRAAGGSSDSSITWELGPQEGSRYKIAIVRSEGSLKFFADGSLIGENTNNVPDELTYYNVFAGNGAQQLNQYAIFPTALTDSECIALTTL